MPTYGYIVNGILEKDRKSDGILQEISKRMYNKIRTVLVKDNFESIYNLKVENLSIKLFADYDKMTLYHRLLQPRLISESKLIKLIKSNKKTQ